jgi:hypothetical protein
MLSGTKAVGRAQTAPPVGPRAVPTSLWIQRTIVSLGAVILASLVALTQFETFEIAAALSEALFTEIPATDNGWSDEIRPETARDFTTYLGFGVDSQPTTVEIALSANLAFAQQVLLTALAAVPASALVVSLSFLLVATTMALEYFNWRRSGQVLILIFDLMPYVLFSLFAITIGQSVFEWQPTDWWWEELQALLESGNSRQVQNLVSNFILYVGYALFLIVFLFRENKRWLLAIDRRGILDGLRNRGLREREIFAFIFRTPFLGTQFPRQFFFVLVFSLLLDFAFVSIHSFSQSYAINTVFREGAYHKEMSQRLENEIAVERDVSLEMVLSEIDRTWVETLALENVPQRPAPLSLLVPKAEQPVVAWLRALCTLRRTETGTDCILLIRDTDAGNTNKIDLGEDLYVDTKEGRRIAHEHLARVYTLLNTTLIFSLFFAVFVVFDRKEIFDES